MPGLVENVTTATGLTPHGLLGMEKEAVDTGSRDFWKTMVINGYFFSARCSSFRPPCCPAGVDAKEKATRRVDAAPPAKGIDHERCPRRP
ncbi:hypothetical protein ABVB69_36145 [Streptomyces sp. NPDC000349]|uniref:hypothetical protein n=1 Tax=unclassified Streptomyces TaxID=2593676 RepID=UPI00277F47ED|nr:hypothetical protein [Streptomyces sp. DSM 40167]MDQ0401610.1 hypothetical protein [Streptomyces sp. DSM 40167]